MELALGLRSHSGWAALVAVGRERGALRVAARTRIELVRPEDAAWAGQPYHAAEGLDLEDARSVVRRAVESARRLAARELARCARERAAEGHAARACAVLVGTPVPDWSVEEILAVHFRMHKAEGALFTDALLRGAEACDLRALALPEKELARRAEERLGRGAREIEAELAALGRALGPPWGRDQKQAALAAWIALGERGVSARARSTPR
jgi:hypothetical protein